MKSSLCRGLLGSGQAESRFTSAGFSGFSVFFGRSDCARNIYASPFFFPGGERYEIGTVAVSETVPEPALTACVTVPI